MLAILAAVYLPFLIARIGSEDVFWFVHMGRQTLVAATTSDKITTSLHPESEVGYDGQYYYALAVDPRHAQDYMPDDIAGIVYSRPLYPALARLLGGGSTGAVPYTMLLLNLFAVAAGTLAVAAWVRRRGLPTFLALLYGLFPGLIFCVFRDLTEPVAFGLVAIALLVLDGRSRRALAGAAALFALAALARETTLLFAAATALVLALEPNTSRSSRARWLEALLFAMACAAPLLIWRALVDHWVSGPTQERADGLRSLVPFHGIAHYWPWDDQHVLIVAAVVVPTVISLLRLPTLVRGRDTAAFGVLLALSAAAFVVFLPTGVDIDYGSAGRAAIGVVLASIVCFSANGGRRRTAPFLSVATAVTWSLPWFLLAAAALGLNGFALVTS